MSENHSPLRVTVSRDLGGLHERFHESHLTERALLQQQRPNLSVKISANKNYIVDTTLVILVPNRVTNHGALVESNPTFFRFKNPAAVGSGFHSVSTSLTLHTLFVLCNSLKYICLCLLNKSCGTKVIRRRTSYILARNKTRNGINDPAIFIRNYDIGMVRSNCRLIMTKRRNS